MAIVTQMIRTEAGYFKLDMSPTICCYPSSNVEYAFQQLNISVTFSLTFCICLEYVNVEPNITIKLISFLKMLYYLKFVRYINILNSRK